MNDVVTCFHKGLSYKDYRQMIEMLLGSDRTTGPNQSAAYVEYTRQNVQRMNRTEKVVGRAVEPFAEALRQLEGCYDWLVFTEAWCGDAANIIPVLAAMADASPQIDLRLVMRDDHPEVFNNFLTAGSRSIPKLVIMEPHTSAVIGRWGPRPKEAMALYLDLKSQQVPMESLIESLTLWYARDKGRSTVKEVIDLIQKIESTSEHLFK